MKPLLIQMIALIAVFLGGCQSSGIVQISPDTYMLSRSSAAGAFANIPKLRARVISEANAFAEKQGKVAIPISADQHQPEVGFPSFDYQFRVVHKDDPEAVRTKLMIRTTTNGLKRADIADATLLPQVTPLTDFENPMATGGPIYAKFQPDQTRIRAATVNPASLRIFGGPNNTVYLGNLGDSLNPDSIFNTLGPHGSKYQDASIMNPYSEYGSKYSEFSPWNQYASNPPIIVDADGRFYGKLTINSYAQDPDRLPEPARSLVVARGQ